MHNGLHQVSGVILGKLYTNTLLVIFNNRMIMANKGLYQSEVLSGLGFNMPQTSADMRTTDVEGQSTMVLTDTQLSIRAPPSFGDAK